jgi:hypothetical protein
MRVSKIYHLTPTLIVVALILLLSVRIGVVGASDEKASGAPPSPANASEQIRWQVISSGGTDGHATTYALKGTIGQTAVGHAQTTQYAVDHGFWQPFAIDTSCCGRYTGGYTGNTDCDIDGKRNLADITVLIDHVYISKTNLCCRENGNVDGSLDGKINLADITALIDHVYISKLPTAACP